MVVSRSKPPLRYRRPSPISSLDQTRESRPTHSTRGRNARQLLRGITDGAQPAPFAADYSRDAAWSPDGRFLIFNGADAGPTFAIKALTADGRPRTLPDLILPRGARRLVFMPGGNSLIVLKGAAHDRNFWLVDIQTGQGRPLTDFDPGFSIGDFDVSADGRDIVFDRLRDESDSRTTEQGKRSGKFRMQ
ncbi:MAG: hypothetical protein M3Q13_08885, partial [Pseudomonadota bacterium]|nr:hypothetical protein [Pseudomonadota bacterium]